MTKNEKRLVLNGIFLPVVLAIILSVLFVGSVDILESNNSFINASVQSDEIKKVTSLGIKEENGIIAKSSFQKLEANSIIGNVNFEDKSLPLIYSASAVNANDKFNIDLNSTLPGEIGPCFAQVYKNNSSKIKLASKGDLINIDTFYSSYEYEVIKTLTVKNDYELKKVGAGLSRVLVLYTDNSVGAGISNKYYVCVAVMKTGTKVNA